MISESETFGIKRRKKHNGPQLLMMTHIVQFSESYGFWQTKPCFTMPAAG
jgi:hypothetical protein